MPERHGLAHCLVIINSRDNVAFQRDEIERQTVPVILERKGEKDHSEVLRELHYRRKICNVYEETL